MPPPSTTTTKPKTFTVGPVATPEGRLSFPHLSAPETTGQFPSNKYVATILIPKTSDMTALKTACLQAAQGMWPSLNITQLNQIRLPFRDGDEKAQMPGMAGSIYLKCKSSYKPPVVGGDKRDYVGPIKAGDFVRFSVTAFPFKQNLDPETGAALRSAGKMVIEGTDEQGRKVWWRPSVTFMLDAVQWKREGESLGAGTGGVAAFDDGDAPAAAGGDIFG